MPKQTEVAKSAAVLQKALTTTEPVSATYQDALATLDQIEIDMKRLIPALEGHAGAAFDPSHHAAIHRARAACIQWVNSFDSVRRPRNPDPKQWSGEPILPKSQ